MKQSMLCFIVVLFTIILTGCAAVQWPQQFADSRNSNWTPMLSFAYPPARPNQATFGPCESMRALSYDSNNVLICPPDSILARSAGATFPKTVLSCASDTTHAALTETSVAIVACGAQAVWLNLTNHANFSAPAAAGMVYVHVTIGQNIYMIQKSIATPVAYSMVILDRITLATLATSASTANVGMIAASTEIVVFSDGVTTAICYNALTNELLWTTALPATALTFSALSMTRFGQTLFVYAATTATNAPTLMSLDKHGNSLYTVAYPSSAGNTTVLQLALSGDDSIAVIGFDATLLAVETATGAVRWQFALEYYIDVGPVVDGAGNVIVVTSGIVISLRLQDGTFQWEFPTHSLGGASNVIPLNPPQLTVSNNGTMNVLFGNNIAVMNQLDFTGVVSNVIPTSDPEIGLVISNSDIALQQGVQFICHMQALGSDVTFVIPAIGTKCMGPAGVDGTMVRVQVSMNYRGYSISSTVSQYVQYQGNPGPGPDNTLLLETVIPSVGGAVLVAAVVVIVCCVRKRQQRETQPLLGASKI